MAIVVSFDFLPVCVFLSYIFYIIFFIFSLKGNGGSLDEIVNSSCYNELNS